MLVKQKEKVEILEEKEMYKIICSLVSKGRNFCKWGLSLNGSLGSKTSMVDAVIDHKPNEEEIAKAIDLAKKKNALFEKETFDFELKIEVKKLKVKKVKKTIVKTEEIIGYEKEWEDA